MIMVQDWGHQPAIAGELMRPHDSLRVVAQAGFDLATVKLMALNFF